MYFGPHVPSAEHVVDLIHMWVGRAGALPLTIKFGWSNRFHPTRKETESNADRSLRIYDALSKYTSRWESLIISLPAGMLAPLSRSDDVPLLRYLSMRIDGYHGCKVPFLSAPRLTTLDIYDLRCKPSKIPTIPWHQLTVLCISEGPSFPTALDLIKCCLRLEKLTISCTFNYDRMDERPCRPRIEHATLREIFVHDRVADTRPFLDSLSLPALKRLSLYGSYSSTLTELFNQSNCELESLSLSDSGFDPDNLQECLEHKSCETLTHLCITTYGSKLVNDELLVRLTCYEGEAEGPLCPNLEQLTFKNFCPWGTSPGVLGRMALSRCVGRPEVKRLQTLDFTARSPLLEEDVELLKCAVLNGLRYRFN